MNNGDKNSIIVDFYKYLLEKYSENSNCCFTINNLITNTKNSDKSFVKEVLCSIDNKRFRSYLFE